MGCAAIVAGTTDSEGSAGLGDPYYPLAGNGGYDVQHYDVGLRVGMDQGWIEGDVTIRAIASQPLRSFHLDLFELEVLSVQVNGDDSDFEHAGGELIVRPEHALTEGEEFRVRVTYQGHPQPVPDPAVLAMGLPGNGWLTLPSGTYVLSECIGAAGWMPCNNHPMDKATFAFEVDAPAVFSVAANGNPSVTVDDGDRRTHRFEMNHPMATYLATVNIAEFELRLDEGPGGIPLYHYYFPGATNLELLPFARTKEMMEHFIECFGPYPFDSYGGVLAAEDFNGALETQSLPVYSRDTHEDVVAHELAHMWFGDSVTPSQWKDIWLNEGFAVYATWLWREHLTGSEGLQARAETTYLMSLNFETGSPYDPGVDKLFGTAVYSRGALVLHALRSEVGDEAFFAILRGWATSRAGGTATTEDFIEHCEQTAGRDLGELFETWLYGALLPELPEYLEEGGSPVEQL